ncbi:hypothetical protein AOQ84DRAFT_354318 [Glonium stellatum]|uniref:Uncharacterized protein n=1 Tax=Glonium stellatum TaxID=574774 RepID=A0A8E2JTC1_9PEZI|nr:hypothetical protein AOQ84DRAFT_354318 [Glonium stellatum]
MYAKLGLGWGNSPLGFLALVMCALPWVFWRFGERVRMGVWRGRVGGCWGDAGGEWG